MVFSDNVPLALEVALKERADAAGVLVMGPDCGTAVVGGVGLGFANVVRPGPVGLVAASGTGAQQLMALLDGAGVGISHCLGVGGRDLSAEVAGRSTLRALDLLDADPDTTQVVVISKPPAPAVAEAVRAHAASLSTPVRFALLGPGQPDLTETAAAVVADVGGTWAAPEHWTGAVPAGRAGGRLRGLYAGGTLCDEAMLLATARVGRVASNIPLDPGWALADDLASVGDTMIDFGDDRLTRGRPHPMIDGSVRAQRVLAEVADPTCGVLLLDVVLGLGAADDPAGELAAPVRAATDAGVPVVAVVVGTGDDPQGLRGAGRRAAPGRRLGVPVQRGRRPVRPRPAGRSPHEPHHAPDGGHRRRVDVRRRAGPAGGRRRRRGLAATGRRPDASGGGDGRPAAARCERQGAGSDARCAGAPGRRTPGVGGARAGAGPAAARRSPGRLGARLRADARSADRGAAVRGLGGHRGAGRAAAGGR